MAGLQVFTSKDDMRNWSRQQKLAGKRVAFVPTMVRERAMRSWLVPQAPAHAFHVPPSPRTLNPLQGYLHEGHIGLVREAR